LQKFKTQKKAQVQGYKSFGYIRETENMVYVTRETGMDTAIPFEKIIIGIEAFKTDPNLYHQGPVKLREYGITHVTSPIWSLLHLLDVSDYQ
jgi:hypothetical protein